MIGVVRITDKIVMGMGSTDKAIDILRSDDSDDSIKFITFYDTISPSDRETHLLRLEEIIIASGLTTRRFMELLAGATLTHSTDITKMMMMANQPEVVKATIEAATERRPILDATGTVVGFAPGDVKAMDLFHTMTGLKPTSKGITVNQNQLNQTAVVAGKVESQSSCPPPPSMDDFLLEMQPVLKTQRNLPEPSEVALIPENAPDIEYIDVEA